MMRTCWAILLLTLAGSGCEHGDGDAATNQQTSNAETSDSGGSKKLREPAVAGMFYPRDAVELGATVDRLLAEAKREPLGKVRGLVAPHAGYPYSGPTAATAYKQLQGQRIDAVVVMAPSHFADFDGASIEDVAAYVTPLGRIPLSLKAVELAEKRPFCRNPACKVQRPDWWREVPKKAPPFGHDTPDTWEHSLEVQLPFLQRALGEFTLVPIVFGRGVDPKKAAEALSTIVDDRTLVVASSDLSHYHPYEKAKQLDASCIQVICDLDVKRMVSQEACGKVPILTLMYLAKARGWKAKLLDQRNSGDTAGDRSGVVGYAAIAFYDDGRQTDEPPPAVLTSEERVFLLDLARRTVDDVVNFRGVPKVNPEDVSARLREKAGCFVTLTKQGQLRGCLGHIFAKEPLYEAVLDNARLVTYADERFPPVTREELPEIEVEVSVLSTPKPLRYGSPEELLQKLRPGVDGVVLRLGSRQSTFLPQVWEKLPDAERFLTYLSEKAGLPAGAWKNPQIEVLTYQVEAFGGQKEGNK